MCKHTQILFCLTFKLCEKPSKFFQKCCKVNNYADTVSAWSTTILAPVREVNDYFSTCPHSQRLRGHAIFTSIKFLFWFLLSAVNDHVDSAA